jgi:hypothetical protein
MPLPEMSNEQRRQLIDAQQAFASWLPAARELAKMGTMRSQASKGRRYMYEVHGTVRKSLGPETPALLKAKAEQDARRAALRRSLKAIERRLDDMAPVNRALGLGRMPNIAARIVRALDRASLLGSHIIVAGTNALYAYEAATGTILPTEHVATTDADLLWDAQESLELAVAGVRREGIMGILRRVDHSFVADYRFNARNADGYIVDLLCPETDDTPTLGESGDLVATPMKGVEWLLAAPRFEQTIVGEDGLPFLIVVPEPRTFALHKLWVSRRDSRQPLKRPRDASHAHVVAALVHTYLRLPFSAKEMPWLAPELRTLIPELKTKKHRDN